MTGERLPLARPTLRSTGGVYEFRFSDERHGCRVDRLSTTARHETTAEITIWSDDRGHIHQSRLNLTSGESRKRMAAYLTEQWPGMRWSDFLEYVCVMALSKHREGHAPVQIAEHPMPDGIQWRLAPYLQEHQQTVMFGDGGSGKSWLALCMGLLVASGHIGWRMMPMDGNVLYLDYETDADTVWERVNKLSMSVGLAIPDNFFYREMVQTVATDIIEIAKIVLDHDIKLIIVDSAAPATSEPESQSAVTEYFRALRDVGCTTLTVAHISKAGRGNQPFGSIFWRNAPRSNLRVYGQSERGGFISAIRHTKSNNGQLVPDRAIRFRFDGDQLELLEAAPSEVTELADDDHNNPQRNLEIRARIMDVLTDGARTVREIVEHTGDTEAEIRQILQHDQGLFIHLAQPGRTANQWGLRAHGENG